MNKKDKIYIAGHRGMVGSALVRNLQARGYSNLVSRTSSELDLRDQQATDHFFKLENPDYVFLAAAKVGGIQANNTFRAEFIFDNLAIEMNVIEAAYRHQVKKLLFLGSSCIYPKDAPQPLKEEYLLSGYLEPSNEPYAIAKIAGIKLCESFRDQYGCNFIAAMPTNLYGPHDNYNLNNSHVLPALIRKIHEAKINHIDSVEVWGSGKPLREFIHVDDLAEACVMMMLQYNDRLFLNIGSGQEISIRELAQMICSITGYSGTLRFNPEKPDGTPRKLLDSSRINALGWRPSIGLKEGIQSTYELFKNQAITA